MLRLSLMTINMAMPVLIKVMMEHDMEDAMELYEEMLDLVKDAGFEAVDVSAMEVRCFGVETVKEQLDKRNLKVSSLIHFGEFATGDEEKAAAVVEEGKQAVDQALFLGTNVLMLVPQAREDLSSYTREQIQENLIRNFTPVTALAVEKGVHSVIEDTPDLRLQLCTREDVEYVLSRVPGQELVYDSGNMILVEEDPIAYYDAIADRTAHIPLKDMK